MRHVAEHTEMNHAGRGVLLMLGGVVVGAAVGLLAAPQSGERTRRQLVRTAEDTKDRVAEVYDDVTEKVKDLQRGATRKFRVGKLSIDTLKRELLTAPPGLSNPLSRLIHTLRG